MKKKCFECDSYMQPSDVIEEVNSARFFCSQGCLRIYTQRLIDYLTSGIGVNKLKIYTTDDSLEDLINIKDEYEQEKVKYKTELVEIKRERYFEGYIQGLLDGAKVCPRCKKNNVQSPHHIQPRKYGGEDEPENIIVLCLKCHNIVEEFTCELYHQKSWFEIAQLKNYILHGFPQEEFGRVVFK